MHAQGANFLLIGGTMLKHVIFMLILLGMTAPAIAIESGDVAPAWDATDFSGDALSFPQMIAGKPTVLIFWATWCGYCKAFMPHLAGIQEDYGADKVNIVAINAREKGEGDPAAYIEGLGFSLTAVTDGDAIADDYGIRFIPGLMIVGTDGDIAWVRGWTDLPAGQTVAELWDKQVREQLDRLLMEM